MRSTFLWRNKKLELIAKKKKPYLVAVSDRAECQQTGDLGGEFTLGLCGAAEISGCAHVHDQHHSQFAFFGELLNEGAAEPRRHIPVNRANLVTGLIFAYILKIHSPPLEHAMVITGERGLDQGAGFDLQSTDLPQNFFCALFLGRHRPPTE